MRIFGKFRDIYGKECSVDILSSKDKSLESGRDTVTKIEAKAVGDAKLMQTSIYKAAAEGLVDALYPRKKPQPVVNPTPVDPNDNDSPVVDVEQRIIDFEKYEYAASFDGTNPPEDVDVEFVGNVDIPDSFTNKTTELVNNFSSVISVPRNGSTFIYLKRLLYEAYGQYYNGKSNFGLPYLYDKSLFPSITEYYGTSKDSAKAYKALTGWLFALFLTRLRPDLRNDLLRIGYNLGPDKDTYIYKYEFHSDQNIARLVAAAICSMMVGRFAPVISNMREEVGTPSFSNTIQQVSSAGYDDYASSYYITLSDFMPTAPGPYVSGYENRNDVGGVPYYSTKKLSDNNLKEDYKIYQEVVKNYNLANPDYKQAVIQAIANKETSVYHIFGENKTTSTSNYTFHPVFGNDTIGKTISTVGSTATAYAKIATIGSKARFALLDGIYYGRRRPGQSETEGKSKTGADGILVNYEIENNDGSTVGYYNSAGNWVEGDMYQSNANDYEKYVLNNTIFANSYPSGHSSQTFAGALFLMELLPSKADLILKAANQYAVDRQITRYHWNSDTIIGRVLGSAMFGVIAGSSDYSSYYNDAKNEVNPNWNPADPSVNVPSVWKSDIESTHIQNGQYLWIRKTTHYIDDPVPEVTYTVSYWNGNEEPKPEEDINTGREEGNIWYGEDAKYTIGEDGIYFAGNPFETTCEIEDNFDSIIKQTAVLRLVVDKYVGNIFFSYGMRESRIIVKREDQVIFSGFLTMNVYNQPFNTDADIMEIQCIDKLSSINNYNYNNTFPETYKTHKVDATVVSFRKVLYDALYGLSGNIWYDCSKSVDGERWDRVFDDIGVGENVFYGDDFDGMMTREDSLIQILQYLNLHIVQHKEDFYIFDWESIKKGNTTWKCLTDAEETDNYGGVAKILTGDMHMAMDTQISIGDVYSQVQVNCEVDEAEDLLADMFDDEDLKSYFNNCQLYMTEYISEGNGSTAQDAFKDIINNRSNTYESCSMVDWYAQSMYNDNWTMTPNNPIKYDISEGGRYLNQDQIFTNAKNNSLSAGIFNIGKVERKGTEIANGDPVPKLDLKSYLYITINGNEDKGVTTMKPNDAMIDAAEPIVVYSGNTATGAFSPVDYETTNYLVFEGKIELQPIQKESGRILAGIINAYNTVPSENNDDGRFYSRKWYKFLDCMDKEPTSASWTSNGTYGYNYSEETNKTYSGAGLMMPAKDKSFDTSKVDKHEDPFKFDFSAEGDATDRIRKVPVLECSLRIGDKKLVEYNIKEDGSSDFGWFKDGQEPFKVFNGKTLNVKATTFTLGFNPAIGDVILGKEFPIQNTVDFRMNIDAKGTAIPITKDDALSGDIDFKILGPCTTVWNQVIRIHPSFWRHTSWEQDCLPILAFTENIIISEFSMKVVSDKALSNTEEDNDLMYIAQETDYNFNTKHETDFGIITQLDSATAKAKGIKAGIYLNAAVNNLTGEPLESLFSKKEGEKKAEEHYVYDNLEDWKNSRVTLEMTLHDDDIDFRDRFGSIPLKKSFTILGVNRNLKNHTAKLSLREYAEGLNDF